MVAINETTIAMTAAVLGIVFSIVWLVLAVYGIGTARELLEELRDDGTGTDG